MRYTPAGWGVINGFRPAPNASLLPNAHFANAKAHAAPPPRALSVDRASCCAADAPAAEAEAKAEAEAEAEAEAGAEAEAEAEAEPEQEQELLLSCI